MTWAAANMMDVVWKSVLSMELKVKFFRATVKIVLLYGAKSWTLTRSMWKQLDGTYTRLNMIRSRRLSFVRHVENRTTNATWTTTMRTHSWKYVKREPTHNIPAVDMWRHQSTERRTRYSYARLGCMETNSKVRHTCNVEHERRRLQRRCEIYAYAPSSLTTSSPNIF